MGWLKLQRDTYQHMQYYTYTEVSAKKILKTNLQIKLCLPGLDKLRTWCSWARSDAWNLWSAPNFSGAHILPCKKKQTSRPTNFRSNRWNSEKVIVNSKYYHEHKWTCNILMFTYLMMSILTYLLIDWETFNCLH